MQAFHRGWPLGLGIALFGFWAYPMTASGQEIAAVRTKEGGAGLRLVAEKGQGDSFARTFEKVWQTVRENLYDVNFNGKDWKRIGDIYRAKLADVKSKQGFADLINRMLDELKLSHTGYYTDDDMEFYMLPSVLHGDLEGNRVAHIGLMGQRAGSEYLVTACLEGGPADKAGIRSGDRLVAADGQPFSTVGSFRGKARTPVTMTLRREGEAKPITLKVTPVRENLLNAFLTATRESARIIDLRGKKLGYVHLWTMGHEAFRALLDQIVLTKLHDTDGLILDLRDGFGGFPWGYGDVFFRPDVAWEQQTHQAKMTVRHTGYSKPMVVLTNGGTRSAKESLAYIFKTSRRAVVVGSRTAGAFLGAGSFPINKEGLLELAVIGLRLDGKRLEGVGVSPDIVVEPEQTYTDKDAQLIRGVQTLMDTIQHARPVGLGEKSAVMH